MNLSLLLNELGIDKKHLDNKKQQTNYKMKYVVAYVERWLLVSVNRPDVKNINFVDCMSNAGVYRDGDAGTSIEVLMLFLNIAQKYSDKSFNLFVNDYNKTRIDILNKIAHKLMQDNTESNVQIHIDTLDVNDYLNNYTFFNSYLYYGSSTVVFIDPYDFGTVKIDRISNFIKHYYCEIIFNFFSSDYVRNGIDDRIRSCIGDVDIRNKDELISYIVNQMKVGKIKYVFSYKFKTCKNTELYQIIYATPHIKGLEVLKEALWETFNGKFYYRNIEECNEQLSLFTEEDEKQSLLCIHANSAKYLLTQQFCGRVVGYNEIEKFLIENTMMKATDFLKSVLKPLIDEGKVIKKGIIKNKANYKKDEYYFKDVQL